MMLTENDVVEAVCDHLKRRGFRIVECRNANQRGVDIVAANKRSGLQVRVEAKGSTSSRKGSNRHGQRFRPKQVKHHVAMAFYQAAKLRCEHPGRKARIGVAFPETPDHRRFFESIARAADRLHIDVLWVDENTGTVSRASSWPNGR